MIENSVVLPAPFGPMRAVIRRAEADSEAPLTAIRPPKPRETASTARRGSATRPSPHGFSQRHEAARQRLARLHKGAGKPARRKRDHQHEHAAEYHQIETGDIAGYEFGAFAKRFDHQCTDQRA